MKLVKITDFSDKATVILSHFREHESEWGQEGSRHHAPCTAHPKVSMQ